MIRIKLKSMVIYLAFSILFTGSIMDKSFAQIISISEGFEGTSGSAMPAGWGCNNFGGMIGLAAGTMNFPVRTGSRCAYLFPKTSVTIATGYLVTPLIAAGTWTFSFWIRQSSAWSETYAVGICDDQSGLNFTTSGVSPASFTVGTTYTQVSFTMTFLTNKYIAISTGIGNSKTLDIDDVTMTGTPLPIELIEFYAINNNNTAELKWTTVSEINNDFFTVYKSFDCVNWQEMAIIKGAGNSNALMHYSYTDLDPFRPVSYYKLKQTDFDGNYHFSEMISLDFTESIATTFCDFYPNPASSIILFEINAGNEMQEVRIIIYDITGKELKKLGVDINFYNKTIDVSDLKSGTYFVKLSAEKKVQYKKLVINR